MNIPGLLIEYIISGAIAISWILILLITYTDVGPLIQKHATIFTLISIPFAYILGMLIDVLIYPVVKGSKHRIRDTIMAEDEISRLLPEDVRTQLGRSVAEIGTTIFPEKHLTDNLVIKLQLAGCTELVKEVNWRSSRDRIARGMIFNSFAITISLTLLIHSMDLLHSAVVLSTGLLLSVVMSWGFREIWLKFEKLSHRFQVITFLRLYTRQIQAE